MRTFFSYLFSVLATLFALTIIPVERLFDEIMNTQKIVESVKSADLYGQLTRLTAQKLIEQKAFENMKNNPLMPTKKEMTGVLQKSFPEDWFLNNLSATHAEMIRFMADPASRKDHFIGMILTDRKNLLTDNLTTLIKTKIEALPECNTRDLIKISSVFSRLEKNQPIEIGKLDLSCKPPAKIQNLILKSIQKQTDNIISILPDTLHWLKDHARTDQNNSAFDELKSVYRFSQSFAFIGYGLLIFFLAMIVLINYKHMQIFLFRLGFPFILTAILLSIPFVFLIVKTNDIFTMSSMRFTSAGTSIDSMLSDAAQIILSFIKTLTEHYCWNIIYFACILLIIGVGLIIGSQVLKIKPLSPLDERHETNI